MGLARVREAEDEVCEDGDKERNADQERAPELVKRARVARGDHREAFLEDDVAVDEDRGGTDCQRGRRLCYSHESIGNGEPARG